MLRYDIYVKNILYSRQVEGIDTTLISYLVDKGIKTDEIKIYVRELNI